MRKIGFDHTSICQKYHALYKSLTAEIFCSQKLTSQSNNSFSLTKKFIKKLITILNFWFALKHNMCTYSEWLLQLYIFIFFVHIGYPRMKESLWALWAFELNQFPPRFLKGAISFKTKVLHQSFARTIKSQLKNSIVVSV